MKNTKKAKIFILAIMMIAGLSVAAAAQAPDKHVIVNLKGKASRVYKGETVRSIDFYRITGKKGQKVIFEVTSVGNIGVFQVNLIKAGSKETDEPLGIAFEQTRYEYEFQTDGDAIEAAVGAKRGAGASYTLKVTLKQKGAK